MRFCTFGPLHPHFLGTLLLSLLLLLTFPGAVSAASGKEATPPDCTQTGLGTQPVAVQLTRTAELVQATLHSPLSDLPVTGCMAPLQFQIPEDARPPYAVWRDVEGRAVHMDGTPNPAFPNPLPLRLWIHPDGNLDYEVREAGLHAAHAALNLDVAWGTTAVANDLAVLDILSSALGLSIEELGVRRNYFGRVVDLSWKQTIPDGSLSAIHPPTIRMAWELPSELGQLHRMYRLELGGPLLKGTIPPELGLLHNLHVLVLTGSRLSGAIPLELGLLDQLELLELHDNQLTNLPPEIGQLHNLRHLGLNGNQLTALPPELSQLSLLEHLGLAHNQLTILPLEIGQLSQLRALDVKGNQLSVLPSLAALRQLLYLDLSDNLLTTPPPGLAQLPRLMWLDLANNRLAANSSHLDLRRWNRTEKEIPTLQTAPVVTELAQLVVRQLRKLAPPFWYLDLSGNQLSELPPGLDKLNDLQYLDLSGNKLAVLPPEISRLQQLWALDLSHNQLKALPPALSRLSLLEHLNLADNRLSVLPPVLTQISSLKYLDLSGNQLIALPPTFQQLAKLAQLNLSRNQLTKLPKATAHLEMLDTLDLSDNQLTNLPSRPIRLLRYLNLGGNPFTTLPLALQKWNQVTGLGLGRLPLANPTAELQKLVSWNFHHLTHLDLSDNQLTAVPPVLAQLPHLTHLDLSDNQLTAVSPVLARLPPLLSLDLRGNPFTTCLLPLLWQAERYIYPKPYPYLNYDFPLAPPSTLPKLPPQPRPTTDLPFWKLCEE